MPVAQGNPERTMALVPQSESGSSHRQTESNPSANRPSRQPTTLQGLLRFAMEATKAEDAPHDSELEPMDDERKKFLEDALQSMTMDVVGILQTQIRILQKVSKVKADDVNEVTRCEQALDKILEFVDNLDIANDFHKIGGFTVLHPCLNSPHPKIRAGGLELLAVLCQNNPYCQQIILDNEFVPKLLNIIENDDDTQVIIKALYALSGVVRDNAEGFNQLVHYNGLNILLKTLKKNNDKFIIKATFLLTSLCRMQPDLKSRLFFLDYVPTLIQLMSTERSPSHEHVLGLLVSLVEENPSAVAECKTPKYNLKETLQKYIINIRNKDECLEEEQYCKRLLHLLFSGV